MARRFTNDEIESIVSDYQSGMSPKLLSEKYNRNSGTIINKLKNMGLYKPVNHRFTDDEIGFIREHYPKGEIDLILKSMPFLSKNRLVCLCSEHGISADYYGWSDEDLKVIEKYYYSKTLDEIREMIDDHHTNDAIQTKALKYFGYSKDRSWTDDELSILKTYYPVENVDDVCARLPNRTRGSIIRMANNIGIKNKFYTDTYWSKDDESFLVDNWKVMSDIELANALGRELHGIVDKRLTLGFLRCGRYNDATYKNITKFIRGNIGQWKRDSMESCGYCCVLTGSKDFQIHHRYSLSTILTEVIEENDIALKDDFHDYTKDELEYILDCFIKKQSEYPLGVCVRKDIHKMFHQIYGMRVTPDMWDRFVENYRNGEISI